MSIGEGAIRAVGDSTSKLHEQVTEAIAETLRRDSQARGRRSD